MTRIELISFSFVYFTEHTQQKTDDFSLEINRKQTKQSFFSHICCVIQILVWEKKKNETIRCESIRWLISMAVKILSQIGFVSHGRIDQSVNFNFYSTYVTRCTLLFKIQKKTGGLTYYYLNLFFVVVRCLCLCDQ